MINIIMGFGCLPQEDVVDLPSNVSTKAEELAIDAVKNCLEKISLSRVLAVKQFQETDDKGLVNVALGQ